MAHVFNPDDRAGLDTPERRAEMPPEETLLKAGLRPGAVVLDVGCGTGFFAFPAARLAGPRGTVYALDISGVMLAEIRSRAASTGIFNIHTSQVARARPQIPDAPYTLALVADTLHEVDDKKNFLGAICAALRTGARLAVIEWAKKETLQGPPLKERLAEDEVQVLLKKAGFTEPASQPLGAAHVLYTCAKKDAA